MLWLAAPLTGLIVQPIIGHLSDHTWSPRFGRRRPYFLVGAILSSLALIAMPNSSALWMAAGLLWILDASINISMEPFRAFVADMLPPRTGTRGFAMQSLFIGLGAVIASALPWMLTNWFGVARERAGHDPDDGPAVVLRRRGGVFRRRALDGAHHEGASARGPRGVSARKKAKQRGIRRERARDPECRARRCPTRCAAGVGAALHVARPVLHVAVLPGRGRAQRVRRARPELAALPAGRRVGRRVLRRVLGGLLRVLVLPAVAGARARTRRARTRSACSRARPGCCPWRSSTTRSCCSCSMAGVGIAWASILSMPYAILAGSLPREKTGVYMGIFNFFIVIPGDRRVARLRMGDVAPARQQPAGRRRGRRRLPRSSRRCWCGASAIRAKPTRQRRCRGAAGGQRRSGRVTRHAPRAAVVALAVARRASRSRRRRRSRRSSRRTGGPGHSHQPRARARARAQPRRRAHAVRARDVRRAEGERGRDVRVRGRHDPGRRRRRARTRSRCARPAGRVRYRSRAVRRRSRAPAAFRASAPTT